MNLIVPGNYSLLDVNLLENGENTANVEVRMLTPP